MNDRDRNQNWLLDTAVARDRTVAQLENVAWFAIDLLLDVDRIYREYGMASAPTDEVQRLVAGIRHLLLIAPPLEPRPETPTGGAGVGEDPAPSVGIAPVFRAPVDIDEDGNAA